jgi:phenylalanyl-tRNA synthetase beta chain
MQTRLAMVGLRPISNVVDATNYVMLERGQPLHAFDLARLRGARVSARRAGSRQRYETLDGRCASSAGRPRDRRCRGSGARRRSHGRRRLRDRAETVDMLLESAFFTPETVRRRRDGSGSSTESSYRFERGVDPRGRRPRSTGDRARRGDAGGTVARACSSDGRPGRARDRHSLRRRA